MRDYVVSYWLDDFYHTFTIEAENEVQAMKEVVDRIPDTSMSIFHDFKIERAKTVW